MMDDINIGFEYGYLFSDSGFELDLPSVPRAGENVLIHKKFFENDFYRRGIFSEVPIEEEYGGLILVTVLEVLYVAHDDCSYINIHFTIPGHDEAYKKFLEKDALTE